MYEIIMLETVEEFIFGLDPKFQAKIFRTINLLESCGPKIREPHSKKISDQDNLFELRTQLGSNITRIFYCFEKGKIIILLSGYVKKEKKTKKQEIERAAKIKDSYFEEKENENNEI